jgi:putative ABC transport system ATP-binding protein
VSDTTEEPFPDSQDTFDETDLEELGRVRHAVRLVDVSRVYTVGKAQVVGLRGVNLSVDPGEFVVISGPSGSGKTTLLNIIGGIDFASEGRVLVMDVPIGDYDETFRATFRLTNTGFIFQSYNLISTLTALENVMFPMQLSGKSSRELREESLGLLKTVGLSDRFNHLPWQLSSGEQQRVAVARAMANDPSILLADEPTANLDYGSAKIVRELLVELNRRGKTVFVVTHDNEITGLPGVRHCEMVNGELKTGV